MIYSKHVTLTLENSCSLQRISGHRILIFPVIFFFFVRDYLPVGRVVGKGHCVCLMILAFSVLADSFMYGYIDQVPEQALFPLLLHMSTHLFSLQKNEKFENI